MVEGVWPLVCARAQNGSVTGHRGNAPFGDKILRLGGFFFSQAKSSGYLVGDVGAKKRMEFDSWRWWEQTVRARVKCVRVEDSNWYDTIFIYWIGFPSCGSGR